MVKRWFSLFLLFSLSLSACDQINALKKTFFKDGDQKVASKKSEKTHTKKPPQQIVEELPPVEDAIPTAPVPPVPQPPPEPSQNPPSAPPLAPETPQAGPETPLVPLSHFGGVPVSLNLDNRFLYVGFGRQLVVYDHFLNPLASLSLEAPLKKVFAQSVSTGMQLYAAEEGNILEVIDLPHIGAIPKILKSFQADGPFETLAHRFTINQTEPSSAAVVRLFVYLPDRVQILDLSNLQDVRVTSEILLPGISQIYALGDFLYAVSNKNLHVIDATTLEVTSTVSLASPFQIIGQYQEGGATFLQLALQDILSRQWKTLQLMPLVSGGGGIADLGKTFDLTLGVDQVIGDLSNPFIYLVQGEILRIFDVKQFKELNSSSQTPISPIRFLGGDGGSIYAASDRALGSFAYQAEALQENKQVTPNSSVPPLADLPAEDKKEIPPKWTNEKIISLAGNIDAVILLGGGSLLVTNQLAADDPSSPPLFLSKGSSIEIHDLIPLKPMAKGTYDFTLVEAGDFGILMYDEKNRKLFLVKKDLTSPLQEITYSGEPLLGLESLFDGKNDMVYLTHQSSASGGEISLTAYLLTAAKTLNKVGSLSLKEGGGFKIIHQGQKVFVACGSRGGCLVDIGTDRAKMQLLKTIPSSQAGAQALEAQVSPDETIGYLFNQSTQGEAFISLIRLTGENPSEIAVIPNLSLTREEFRGLTFSAGGQTLILPQSDGTYLYNVKNPSKPTLVSRWPIGRAFFADVTDRGQTLCVALGERGVECGSFE